MAVLSWTTALKIWGAAGMGLNTNIALVGSNSYQ